MRSSSPARTQSSTSPHNPPKGRQGDGPGARRRVAPISLGVTLTSKADLALLLGAAGLLASLLGWITTVLLASRGLLAPLVIVMVLATATITAPTAIYSDRKRSGHG
jgi:hypothetical protein